MAAIEILEYSRALDGAESHLFVRTDVASGAWFKTGHVFTEFGIVAVYAEGGDRPSDSHMTRYDFAWRGRLFTRTEQTIRSERGWAIEAAKFARGTANTILKARKA